MKHRLLKTSLILALLLTGCSSGNTAEPQATAVTSENLTGSWSNRTEDNKDDYIAGYVKDDEIYLYRVCDGATGLLWAGDIETRAHKLGFASNANTEKNCLSPWALQADIMNFHVEDDVMTFRITNIMDGSQSSDVEKVTLKRSSEDYTSLAACLETDTDTDLKDIEIVKIEFITGLSELDNETWITAAVNFRNPNPDDDIVSRPVTITALDADGNDIGGTNYNLHFIAAGSELTDVVQIQKMSDTEPVSVEAEVVNDFKPIGMKKENSLVSMANGRLEIKADSPQYYSDSTVFPLTVTNLGISLNKYLLVIICHDMDGNFIGGVSNNALGIHSSDKNFTSVYLYSSDIDSSDVITYLAYPW
jgi:hypothetical protein